MAKAYTTKRGNTYYNVVYESSAHISDTRKKAELERSIAKSLKEVDVYRPEFRIRCKAAPDHLRQNGYFHIVETYAYAEGTSDRLMFFGFGYGRTKYEAKIDAFDDVRISMPNFNSSRDDWKTYKSGSLR